MAKKKIVLYVDDDTGEILRQFNVRSKPRSDQKIKQFFWLFYEPHTTLSYSGKEFLVLTQLASKMGEDNLLLRNSRTPFDKSTLVSIVASNKNAGYICLKKWRESELLLEKDGKFYFNSSVVRRGSLPNDVPAEKMRIAYDGVQAVVEGTSFRRLALLVSLIPYLNLEHNVISDDTFEWDWKNVTPLSDLEIVERLGLLPSTAKRIPSYLLEPVITIRGHRQKMVALVDGKYVLNPRIFYGGSHFKEVLKNFSDLY